MRFTVMNVMPMGPVIIPTMWLLALELSQSLLVEHLISKPVKFHLVIFTFDGAIE